MSPPFLAKWDGEVFRPLPRFAEACAKHYRPDMTYPLAEPQMHSEISRGHYFACVNEAWRNLPEQWGDRFPTPDILRKWALIRAGFCEQEVIACDTKREMDRWVDRERRRAKTVYAEVGIRPGHVVVILTAQTQRKKDMGPKRFQESKTKVLEILANMIDVEVDDLSKQAKSAA